MATECSSVLLGEHKSVQTDVCQDNCPHCPRMLSVMQALLVFIHIPLLQVSPYQTNPPLLFWLCRVNPHHTMGFPSVTRRFLIYSAYLTAKLIPLSIYSHLLV